MCNITGAKCLYLNLEYVHSVFMYKLSGWKLDGIHTVLFVSKMLFHKSVVYYFLLWSIGILNLFLHSTPPTQVFEQNWRMLTTPNNINKTSIAAFVHSYSVNTVLCPSADCHTNCTSPSVFFYCMQPANGRIVLFKQQLRRFILFSPELEREVIK